MCQVPFVPLFTHNAIPTLGSNFQMILHIHILYLYLNGYFQTYSARMSAGNSGPVARFHRLVPGIKLIPLEKLMKTCPHKVGPIPAPRVCVCVSARRTNRNDPFNPRYPSFSSNPIEEIGGLHEICASKLRPSRVSSHIFRAFVKGTADEADSADQWKM
jgi:hypothetical protein